MKSQDIITCLQNQKAELQETYGVEKIGVFGSYATETYHKDSDVDIVVELKKPDLLALSGIKQKLEEALGKRVDIVRYRQKMNRMLKKQIDAHARYV